VRKVLIEESAHADVEIMLVWIDMLAEDNVATASTASKIFQYDRVIQFHDPNRLAGKAIAESLGANHSIAWDMYLFYKAGSKWEEKPPVPLGWAHQLDDLWADPSHFAWGDDLPIRLRDIMNSLIEN